jgi:hypothetical protein
MTSPEQLLDEWIATLPTDVYARNRMLMRLLYSLVDPQLSEMECAMRIGEVRQAVVAMIFEGQPQKDNP